MQKYITLYELNGIVKEVIETSFTHGFWVEAELLDIRESNGHCYMELIQKEEHTKNIVARAYARCWKNKWMLVKAHFERVTKSKMQTGMKILLYVSPQFHESFGFSWIVSDIDPVYTMGDLARKKQEIIDYLKDIGVFDLNKQLQLSPFAQKIAVISSENAAGYGDFIKHINEGNVFNIKTTLFQSSVQGQQTENEIVKALNNINANINNFDCVVIIRGGGGKSDLSCFDSKTIAENVANFPLPIIIGIGHDRDESILDLISYKSLKTPTAVADYIINNLSNTLNTIQNYQNIISTCITNKINLEKQNLNNISNRVINKFSLVNTIQTAKINNIYTQIQNTINTKLQIKQHNLDIIKQQLQPQTNKIIIHNKYKIEIFETKIKAVDPQNILNKGYSLTIKDNKIIKKCGQLKKGDVIETQFKKGKVKSIVQ